MTVRSAVRPAGPSRTGMSPRVLLVDDDEDYTIFVRKVLARMGVRHPLDVVHSEVAAIDALNEHEYDVVVSDYELRPGSGVDVLRHVAKRSPSARRILLTSTPEQARKGLGGDDGLAHGVWDKRWELGDLRDHLTTLLTHP